MKRPAKEVITGRDARGRFRKGCSGNIHGRPKGTGLSDLLRSEIDKICPGEKKTWLEKIVLATMILAIKGNATALREVWERMDGRIKERVVIDEGRPAKVTVILSDLYAPEVDNTTDP
jgi:hypothetical protein